MNWVVLTTKKCPWCVVAKRLLESKGIKYREFDINEHPILKEFTIANGLNTVPQIYHNGKHLGGYEDLKVYL